MKDQAEVVIVPMAHRRAQAQDGGETSRRPVSGRFIGAEHRESHAWIEPARRSGRLGLRRQWFAMSQRNVAKGGPSVANVSFASGIEREDPGVSFVAESFISKFEHSHEAFVKECIVQPAID